MGKIDEIASLIDKYFRNNCSREEFREVIEILKNPYHDLGLQSILSKIWNDPECQIGELSEEEKRELRLSLSTIHHNINLLGGSWESVSNFKKISNIFIKIAAALLLPVMIISLWYFFASRYPYQSTESYIAIDTPKGSKIKTELPDGTTVWQNSGSTVKYPRNFTRRNRQVFLTGEAFFDVKTDRLHPFFVTSGDLLIEVTGTRFNVTSYNDEEKSYIVLERGRITAKRLNSPSSQQFSLIPGDRLVNSRGIGGAVSHNADVEKYISWINDKLIFRDDPLEEILKSLSRWYNVDIVVNDPEGRFRNLPFTMTIGNENLPQILEYLKHAAPLIINKVKLVSQDNRSIKRQKYIISYRK